MRGMDIRRALPADLPAVAAVYAREALEGHATFDLEPRPMDLWEARLALDRACGFEEIGTMREVGRKHERWIDITWLHKVLG